MRVLAATPQARAIARERVRENVRRLGEFGQLRLEEVLGELERTRQRLVAMVAEGTEFDQTRARELIRAVDSEAARLRSALRAPLQQAFTGAARLGDADFSAYGRSLVGDGVRLSQGVSSTLLDTAVSRSADLVGQITETARSTLNRLLRQSATGASGPAEVARAIGGVLSAEARPTGVFGTLATQIERVHRTEVGAMYETAGKARTIQIARESPWVMEEVWIAVLDGRERHDHRTMNGAVIRVGERFNYGAGPVWSKRSYEAAEQEGGTLGTPCTGPLDAILPAEAAVNCRCTRGLRRGPPKNQVAANVSSAARSV